MTRKVLILDTKSQLLDDDIGQAIREAAQQVAANMGLNYKEERLPENFGLTEQFLPEDFD